MHCRTDDGKMFRTLTILDEFSRECLAIRVRRKLNSTGVVDALSDLFILRGVPAFLLMPCGTGSRPSVPGRLDCARLTLGERLLRKIQCPVPR